MGIITFDSSIHFYKLDAQVGSRISKLLDWSATSLLIIHIGNVYRDVNWSADIFLTELPSKYDGCFKPLGCVCTLT